VPADKDLHDVKLDGADLSECDLSGVNLSASDLSCSLLSKANLSEANLSNAKLTGADLSGSDLSGCDLTGVHMQNVNLSKAKLHDARLPAWSSGLMEGVKIAGAEGWVPADKDLKTAKLKGADVSECDLSGLDLYSASLQNVNFTKAKLHDARLPTWSSGLLEGVKLTGSERWVPADKDLSNVKLQGADLSSYDLSGVILSSADLRDTKLQLHDTCLPLWSSGLLEGVKLTGAEGWVPADKDLSNSKLKCADLSNAKLKGTVLKGTEPFICDLSDADLSNAKLQGAVLKGADLFKCDLSGADLSGADLREAKLEGTNLRDATLCAVILYVTQGDRPATTLPVPDSNGNLRYDLKAGKPVVFAFTVPRALTLNRVSLCNTCVDGDGGDRYYAKAMEVQTGPSVYGPWTSVVKFTLQKTWQEQTFAAAPDAPLLAGFVRVLVHDTYDGNAWVKSMVLEGEAWV
jgi:uncharacterized protein YjbI with pentapeptide repeats